MLNEVTPLPVTQRGLPAPISLPGTALPTTILQLLLSPNAHLFPTFPASGFFECPRQSNTGRVFFLYASLTYLPVLPLAPPPIYPHAHPLTHPSTEHSFIYLPALPKTHPPNYSSTHQSILSSIHLSNHPPIKPPSCPLIHPFTHQLIIHPPAHLSIQP